MKRKKRNVLALLGWYDHRILRGIARFARGADWHLPSRHLYDVTSVRTWKGDGVLTTDGTDADFRKFIRRQSRERPTVLIGAANSFGVVLPQVSEDNRAIGQMAARHFLERGHRNFARFSPTGGGTVDRLERFGQASRSAGGPRHLQPRGSQRGAGGRAGGRNNRVYPRSGNGIDDRHYFVRGVEEMICSWGR